jgi:hypothetical protein
MAIRLKMKSDAAAEETENAEAAAAPEGDSPEAAGAAAPVGLEPVAVRSAGSPRGTAVFFSLSLLAVLACCAVLGMQVFEIKWYGQSPSVWIVK